VKILVESDGSSAVMRPAGMSSYSSGVLDPEVCWDIIGPSAVVKGFAHNPTQHVIFMMMTMDGLLYPPCGFLMGDS
jgi:hypothetical protein